MDIHRTFAEAVAWDHGKLKRLGRVDMCRHPSRGFRQEATQGGLWSSSKRPATRPRLLGDRAYVKKVVIANKASAHHRPCEDQDRYDRRQRLRSTLRKRLSAGIWIPDELTQALRRQVTERWRKVGDDGCDLSGVRVGVEACPNLPKERYAMHENRVVALRSQTKLAIL